MSNVDDQISQARERLRDLQAKARKQAHRNETRRKIIYGAAILQLLEDVRGEKAEKLKRLLSERITRASDREFVGLPGKGAKAPQASVLQQCHGDAA